MVLNSKLTERQDFHLSGVMVIILAAILGLALSGAVFVREQEVRATARELAAQAAPPPAPPIAPAALSPKPADPPIAAAPPAPPAQPALSRLQAAPSEVAAEPPAPSTPGSADAGGQVFAANCGACHPNGGAGLGPALLELSDQSIVRGTRDGKGMMPAFGSDRLSEQQVQDILAYLRSIN